MARYCPHTHSEATHRDTHTSERDTSLRVRAHTGTHTDRGTPARLAWGPCETYRGHLVNVLGAVCNGCEEPELVVLQHVDALGRPCGEHASGGGSQGNKSGIAMGKRRERIILLGKKKKMDRKC